MPIKPETAAEQALKWLTVLAGEFETMGMVDSAKRTRLAADELEQALTEIATIKASTSYRMRMQQETHIEIIEADLERVTKERDALHQIAADLVAWDEKYPPGRIYSSAVHRTCEGGLDDICKSARKALK